MDRSSKWRFGLFVAESYKWVDMRGTPRRNIRSEERDDTEHNRHYDKHDRIPGLHAKNKAGHQPRERERRGDAHDDANERQDHSLPHDHAANLPGRSA